MLDQDQADPLLAEARAHVVATRRASVGNLMRVLKVGYNRAAWLIEALEAAGVVSRHDAQGQRHVLVEA
ncbi:DNA translocase FtsK [Pseudoxanthomonas winnipegensis]|uniref:DNA translocase FtsK n=1 Tax=Pseudoxanthomonas winnipegensis TaxID=2480810 RepID=UPI003CCCE8A9